MWEVVKKCLAMEYVKSALVVDGNVGTTVMSNTVMVLQAKTRKPWEDETSRLRASSQVSSCEVPPSIGEGLDRAYMKDERSCRTPNKVRPNRG